MNKKELVKSCAARSEKLTRGQMEEALDLAIDVIAEALSRGEAVKIVNFVSLEPTPRSARHGYNPQTDEPITIDAKVGCKATAGKRMKEAVAHLDYHDLLPGGKLYVHPRRRTSNDAGADEE